MFALIILAACALGKPLKTESIPYPEEMPGNYTMILHDVQDGAAIFLDREDDKYRILPPKDTNRFIKGINGSDIAAAGSGALSLFNDVGLIKVREIFDKKGKNVIGYELTPRIAVSKTPPREFRYILTGKEDVLVEYR